MVPPTPPVYLHIGLPKAGTTFLHRVLDANRAALAEQGLRYPAEGTWDAVVREVAGWRGSTLISHELFAVARPDQVPTVVTAFADRPVHVVVTACDLARQLIATWQEDVRNGQTLTLAEYVDTARSRTEPEVGMSGFWYRQDLLGVLHAWQQAVPPERIHLVTVPPRGTDLPLLWQRFAAVVGVELPGVAIAERATHDSLGVVETEFLRRLNVDLGASLEGPQYRAHVTEFLAQQALPGFKQSGSIVLDSDDQTWAAEQSRDVVSALSNLPIQVHGDLSELESPDAPRETSEVTDKAVADVGVRAITQLLRKIGREHSAPATGRAS